MSKSIAKYTKSFFVKVLVGIIILPFIFWGMGDIFRGGNQNIIVTIDSEKISTQEFLKYLNRLNLSDQERESIKKTNLLEKILSEYTGRKIISLEVEKFGIELSNSSLKEIIMNDKTFFKDGKFSRTTYEKFLLESQLTAPIFEANIVEQEKRRQLLAYLSSGTTIPNFLVVKEFRKENQVKKIKYIDLNDYYKNKKIKQEKIKKIFEENKDLFVETYKTMKFVELKPQILIGKDDYNEIFFNKIDKIENSILDGKNFKTIIETNNISSVKTFELNNKKINSNGIKNKDIKDELFKNIFSIKKENSPELIKIDNKFYLSVISKIKKKNLKIDNYEVRQAIIEQLKIKDKIDANTKIVKDISSGKFNILEMESFAKKNSLKVQSYELKNLDNNDVFTKSLIRSIFDSNDGEINLITDSKLSKNFVIFAEKTSYIKLDKNSEKYKEYKSKAKLTFANNIFTSYDDSLNIKYNINLNQQAIDRIKNSF